MQRNHGGRWSRLAAAATTVAALSLAGCANLTPREQNTALGAAVGGVAGSVLTGGNAVGTIGGAVVGGVVGNRSTGR
jgi:osmotically inducible lipoprotein OsmB